MLAGSIIGTTPATPVSLSKDPNSSFYTMMKKIYAISRSLTDDQRDEAMSGDNAHGGRCVTTFGHWFNILKKVLEKENTSLMKGAEAYLRLGISMNESAISCWKAKYQCSQFRPVTYPGKFMGLPALNSFRLSLSRPQYSVVHAAISSSAAYALESVFGKQCSFTDHTYDEDGMRPGQFSGFESTGYKAANSRPYNGIYCEPSIDVHLVQGRKIAENVSNFLKTH
jgi:hypothetical protein